MDFLRKISRNILVAENLKNKLSHQKTEKNNECLQLWLIIYRMKKVLQTKMHHSFYSANSFNSRIEKLQFAITLPTTQVLHHFHSQLW
jgi:hypothetical protein